MARLINQQHLIKLNYSSNLTQFIRYQYIFNLLSINFQLNINQSSQQLPPNIYKHNAKQNRYYFNKYTIIYKQNINHHHHPIFQNHHTLSTNLQYLNPHSVPIYEQFFIQFYSPMPISSGITVILNALLFRNQFLTSISSCSLFDYQSLIPTLPHVMAKIKMDKANSGTLLLKINGILIIVGMMAPIIGKEENIRWWARKGPELEHQSNIDHIIMLFYVQCIGKKYHRNRLSYLTLYHINLSTQTMSNQQRSTLHWLILTFTLLVTVAFTLTQRGQAIEFQINTLMQKSRNKVLAMLTNPTSTDGTMRPIFQRILQKSSQYNVTLKCFFAPEHGLRGDQQDGKGDEDYIDKQTGIQVFSLYGARKAPTASQLEGVDILLYDIQDVGARYYTYMWTLTYTLEVIAQLNKKLLIFDRPNPLGRKVQGCPLTMDTGLVGRLLPGQTYSIPIRYGLTVGEFIGYLSPYLPKVNYEVIKMGNKIYQILDQQWVMSSPNIPTLATVHVYAGLGLVQCTNISEGRGTTKPFQLTGYPGIQSKKLVDLIKKSTNNTGALFRQSYIIPTFNKHANQICGGLEVMPKGLTQDFNDYDSVETALHIIKSYLTLNSTISVRCDRMFGIVGFSENMLRYTPQQILADCKYNRDLYIKEYKSYWLYPGNDGEGSADKQVENEQFSQTNMRKEREVDVVLE